MPTAVLGVRGEQNLYLTEDDPYLLAVERGWNERIVEAFNALPHFQWQGLPDRPRFE